MKVIEQIPWVADAEVPYVVARRRDRRPSLEFAGSQLRRYDGRVDMEVRSGEAYLHATMVQAEGCCLVMSSVGTYYNCIWNDIAAGSSMLRGIDLSLLPVTSSVVTDQPFLEGDSQVPIYVNSYEPPGQETICVVYAKLHGPLETDIEMGILASAHTIATAIRLLAEIGFIAQHVRGQRSARRNDLVDVWLNRVDTAVGMGTDIIGMGTDIIGKVRDATK